MLWAQWVLRYRHSVFAILLAIVVLGVQARFMLPVQLFPDTDPPTVTVVTEYPGMAAVDVDAELTRLLEDELAGIDGVVNLSSSSQAGLSVIKVEFQYGMSATLATVDVQNAIGRIARQLPATINDPQVLEFSTAQKPIVTIALRGKRMTMDAIRELADNPVRERLERVAGVAAIDIIGGHKRELHIALDPLKMQSHGLRMEQVVSALASWNLRAPGGRIPYGELESVIRFEAPILSVEDASAIIIKSHGERQIRVADVASVSLAAGESRNAYRYMGEEAIAVQVLRRDEANTVEVAARVRAAIDELREHLPELELLIADDDSVFTELVIRDMTKTVILAVALTMLIVLLFLADFRQSIIIALSIPFAFLSTFVLMQFAGLDLNMITMSALILAIGLLVDDGIVVLENIHRHIAELGQAPRQAAIEGVGEVLSAKLGGTLTTLGVLIPLTFMGSFIGELFRPLAMTLAFALASSFVIAVTLIPLLGAFWLKAQPTEQAATGLRGGLNRAGAWVKDYYLAGLGWALRFPLASLGGAVLLLLLSLGMLRLAGSEMLPRFDSGDFRVLVDMVPGTTLQDTLEGVSATEQALLAQPYTHSLSTRIGHEAGARAMGNRGAMSVNQAEMTVKLIPRTERELNQWQIMERVREVLQQTPGVLLGVPQEMGGTARASTAAPILVRISGERPEELDRLGDELLRQLAGIPGMTDLYKDWSLNTPEIRVLLDNRRVAELGLTAEEVARAVHQSLDGRIATRYRQPPWRDLNVMVRYAAEERAQLEDLENISLMTAHGAVPLRELARLERSVGTRVLTREDGTRSLDILGFHLGRPLSEVVSDVEARLAGFAPPEDYQVYLVGEQADFDEARGHMIRALLLAAMAVYLLLVVQFRSFVSPVTIMSAIPLQFIGVASALLLAGKYLSMPALLGIILLIGIVVNNSIMLLDVAQRRLAEGWKMDAALIDAVNLRLRPIMMTGMSTIAGMLPLALEMAVGSERFSPIATVIIGGVITATILTLIVVPTLYKVLSRAGRA